MTDLFSLQGRTALITGGSRGIGRMIAAGFLAQGAKVYISSRKAAACDATAAELAKFGRCVSLPADVSTVDGAHALAAAYAGHETMLDILVNNAGAAWAEPFDDFSEKGWDKVVDLNLKTPFFLTQALIGPLRAAAAQRPAKVIHIASIDGVSVNPMETYSYAASKAGLIHLTRRMALAADPRQHRRQRHRARRLRIGHESRRTRPRRGGGGAHPGAAHRPRCRHGRRGDLPRLGRRGLRGRPHAGGRRRRDARARLRRGPPKDKPPRPCGSRGRAVQTAFRGSGDNESGAPDAQRLRHRCCLHPGEPSLAPSRRRCKQGRRHTPCHDALLECSRHPSLCQTTEPRR